MKPEDGAQGGDAVDVSNPFPFYVKPSKNDHYDLRLIYSADD